MLHKKKYLLTLSTFLFFISLFTLEGTAQTDFFLSWNIVKDDNTFKSRYKYEELINTASFLFTKGFTRNSLNFQVFYDANLSIFNNYKDQRNYAHNIGTAGRLLLGNYEVDFGLNAQFRRNNAQYIFYNTNNYNLFARLRFEPGLSEIYTIGLSYTKNEFTEFIDINNNEFRLYGKFQKFFQSRLSISGEAGLSVKNYVNQTAVNYFGTNAGVFEFPRQTENSVKATIFSISANIAKSITSKTGVNGKFGGQWFVGDPIEVFSQGIYYYTENDLYDDPHSYENRYISLNFTRQFDVDLQGKFGIEYQKKYYRGTPALDIEGELIGMNREDTRKVYNFLISKKIQTKWRYPGSINLYFRFLVRDNSSNDPYYQFTDHLGITGFTISK